VRQLVEGRVPEVAAVPRAVERQAAAVPQAVARRVGLAVRAEHLAPPVPGPPVARMRQVAALLGQLHRRRAVVRCLSTRPSARA
jgi:hypothetical protein